MYFTFAYPLKTLDNKKKVFCTNRLILIIRPMQLIKHIEHTDLLETNKCFCCMPTVARKNNTFFVSFKVSKAFQNNYSYIIQKIILNP